MGVSLMEYYKCKYFKIHELVPPDIYKKYGDSAFQFLDPKMLYTIDKIRERYNTSLTINNYMWNGSYSQSGYRPVSSSVGASNSQHRHGRAFDCKLKGISAEQVREDILNDPYHEDFKYITCIEMKVNWLHIDCRNYNKKTNGILKIYP